MEVVALLFWIILWRSYVYEKNKIWISVFLSIALFLPLFPSVNTALAEGSNVIHLSLQDDTINPNEIKEVYYFLSFNTKSGESSLVQVQEGQSINNIAPHSQNGVLFSVLLQPYEGASKFDISAKVEGFVGAKPNKLEFTLGLYRGVVRGSGSQVGNTCLGTLQGALGVQVGKSVTCSRTMSQTGFYFGHIILTVKDAFGQILGTGTSDTRQILTNKRAEVYPSYSDPYSPKVMTDPARADWARVTPIPWTTSDRGNFIKEYSELYPNNSWNWSGTVTEIHHIRPRNLGGTNDFSNLIPLPKSFHQTIVTPWFSGY